MGAASGTSMSRNWEGGSTHAWRKLRAAILHENTYPPPRGNQGQCRLALRGVCTGPATQVHHTLGRAITGDDPQYLMAVCRECNLKTGVPGRNRIPHKRISTW